MTGEACKPSRSAAARTFLPSAPVHAGSGSLRPAAGKFRAWSASLCLAFFAGCSFHPSVPEGFARYPRGLLSDRSLRSASPDGILYSVRIEKNKPRADLAFWREAMKTRMGQAGYRVVSDSDCVMKGSPGALLKLAAPLGNQDYFYWIGIALSPEGNRILVAEAAGESRRFLARQESIRMAIGSSGF